MAERKLRSIHIVSTRCSERNTFSRYAIGAVLYLISISIHVVITTNQIGKKIAERTNFSEFNNMPAVIKPGSKKQKIPDRINKKKPTLTFMIVKL